MSARMTTEAPHAVEHIGDESTPLADASDEEHVNHVHGGVQEEEAKPAKKRARKPKAPKPAPKATSSGSLAPWAWLLLGGAAAGALLLLRHLRRRSAGKGRPQPVQVPKEQVFVETLHLSGPPPQPLAPQPLAGRSVVVTDRVDVEGVRTRFGSSAWQSGRQPSTQSHAALGALLAAGAQALAVVPSECLGLGPLLGGSADALPNPCGKGYSNGGGDYGSAVAVAAGHADLALAVDELGSARVPAACCGLYALRPTAGVLPVEGASTASHSLAVPALIAREPHALLKAGEALRLPGGGARTDVVSYLVAEDYFSECGERMQRMVPAVIAAVKRWAGPDQAQGLALCEWLYHRIPVLREFMEGAGGEGGGAAGEANGGRQQQQQPGQQERHTRQVLEALAAAAETVRRWEFSHKYGEWVEGAAGSLPQEAVQFQEQAEQVSEERYRAAQAVMGELSSSIRGALQEGYVFVLPTTPAEPPSTGSGSGSSSSSSEGEAFKQRSLEFSALAALSGVPEVILPLPVPGQVPLSISLMSLHRKDLGLLQTAAKLGPLLAEEAAKLVAEQQQSSGGPAAAAAQQRGGGRKGGKAGKQEVDAEQRARAEAAKEDGNAAFKSRNYSEAVRQYSLAVQLDPQNHVYYANRAMAYLKLGVYGQAEADCDSSLKLKLDVKALLRRGAARVAQGNAEGAKSDFKQVLGLEPQNRQAREELANIERMEEQLQGF